VSLKGCSLFLRLYKGRSRGKKGGFEEVGWGESQPREYAVRNVSGFLPSAKYEGERPTLVGGRCDVWNTSPHLQWGPRQARVLRRRGGSQSFRQSQPQTSDLQRPGVCRRCSQPRQGGYGDPGTGCCEPPEPSPGLRARAPRPACRSILTRQAGTRNPLSVLLPGLPEVALAISRLVCLRRPSESAQPTRPSSQAGAGRLGNISFDAAQDSARLARLAVAPENRAPRRGR
jgi:hypothetical protein